MPKKAPKKPTKGEAWLQACQRYREDMQCRETFMEIAKTLDKCGIWKTPGVYDFPEIKYPEVSDYM